MRVLDLFSGIGGFSLGLERAGMETVAFCEFEDFPRRVLKKHWPDVPCYPDVRELTREVLIDDGITKDTAREKWDRHGNAALYGEWSKPNPNAIDLICGGYPCQPFSHAGKREGQADDRHLWPEMHRLIETIRPRWVLAENVAGHISMGLDDVLADLEGSGYAWWTFVIPACAVDARHRRDRVWIIGADTMADTQPGTGQWRTDQPGRRTNNGTAVNGAGEVMAHTQLDGFNWAAQSRSTGKGENERRVPQSQRPCTWPTEPAVGRVAHGIPDRVDRLKALGNAVVPAVVEQIGHAIMEAS